jgi:hypothetical protein
MCSLAVKVQLGLGRSRSTVTHAAGSGERLRIGSASSARRLQKCVSLKPDLVGEAAKPSGRGSGSSLQCAASYAAAPGGDGGATAPQPPQQQPRPLQLPTWGPRAVQLVGAAAAFMAWYSLSAALHLQAAGPFASLGMAAAAPANEGALWQRQRRSG